MDLLAENLRLRVLERLGFSKPPPADLEGLRQVYRAWCSRVPFDNVRKMIALFSQNTQVLPGGTAEDFFEAWLTHGTGGTCWPTSNALYGLLASLGFEARRVAGSMRDLGIVNHASTKVRIEKRDWLVDSSMLTNEPLNLDRGIWVSRDEVFPVEVEPVDGTHLLWFYTPPNPGYFPCRLLVDPADHELYLLSYEASRQRSAFNQRLYARRNYPGEMRILVGNMRYSRTAQGLDSRKLTREGICQALEEDIDLSSSLIEQWKDSGALEASLEPPQGPKPLPTTSKPPSQR